MKYILILLFLVGCGDSEKEVKAVDNKLDFGQQLEQQIKKLEYKDGKLIAE